MTTQFLFKTLHYDRHWQSCEHLYISMYKSNVFLNRLLLKIGYLRRHYLRWINSFTLLWKRIQLLNERMVKEIVEIDKTVWYHQPLYASIPKSMMLTDDVLVEISYFCCRSSYSREQDRNPLNWHNSGMEWWWWSLVFVVIGNVTTYPARLHCSHLSYWIQF